MAATAPADKTIAFLGVGREADAVGVGILPTTGTISGDGVGSKGLNVDGVAFLGIGADADDGSMPREEGDIVSETDGVDGIKAIVSPAPSEVEVQVVIPIVPVNYNGVGAQIVNICCYIQYGAAGVELGQHHVHPLPITEVRTVYALQQWMIAEMGSQGLAGRSG